MYRIGFGYDVHQLISNRDLILGGVKIPYHQGLIGHSDADVLIHAIIDALLGAIALGDIGSHFPDSQKEYAGINSRVLLSQAYQKISVFGWRINNLDTTICAQHPKLQPFLNQMRSNIAQDLNCDLEQISVKATTEEFLGISGSEKGMIAYCIAMLIK